MNAGARSAILFREAARASRQPRTYLVRVAFSAVLIGVILLVTAIGRTSADWWDPASFGSMGRNLFIGFVVVEILAAMVLAPAMVARSIIEEREERPIDLLVLTRLTPGQIFLSKLSSSLLVLTMIVMGATPILAIVTSLGGVSVVEVVAVSLDAVAALVILGVLGGFFSLFTRSQLLATGFAWLWALPVFLILPWFYALLVGGTDGATYLSPLYGTAARGWGAILPVFAFVPVLIRLLWTGSKIFALRASNAAVGRVFRSDVWGTRFWAVEGLTLFVGMFFVVPVGMGLAWSANAGTTVDQVQMVLGRGVVWVWAVFAISWLSWIYFRLGSEWVLVIDGLIRPDVSSAPGWKRRIRPPRIGINPVIWREIRPKMFATAGLMLGAWCIVLFGLFQSLLWLIPGAVLGIALVNFALGWFGATWLATSTIERERRDGTLELLLTTLLRPGQIVFGKLMSVLIATAPFFVIGAPLIVGGMPYASVWTGGNDAGWLALRGAMVLGWAIAFWLFVTVVSLTVAVKVRQPRMAFGINLVAPAVILLLPWMLYSAFNRGISGALLRTLVPVVAVQGPWWEPVFSTVGFFGLATCVLLALMWRFRPWLAKAEG